MLKNLLPKTKKKKPAKWRKGSPRPVVLAAVAVAIAAGAFGVYQYDANKVPASHAYSGNQWCTTEGGSCLNAWNGGPFVKVYEGLGTSNNDFNLINVSNAVIPTTWEIMYTGPGAWHGRCVGDANNDPNNKYTSLDTCPTSGNAGWGTIFTRTACGSGNYGTTLKNKHTGYYLGPLAFRSSVSFYLGFNHAYCFWPYGPA